MAILTVPLSCRRPRRPAARPAGAARERRDRAAAAARAPSAPSFRRTSCNLLLDRRRPVIPVDLGRCHLRPPGRAWSLVRRPLPALVAVGRLPRAVRRWHGQRAAVRDGRRRRTAGSDGAQVAAEAMPYHRHRRTECNTGRRDPGVAAEPLGSPPARSRRRRCVRSAPDRRGRESSAPPTPRGALRPRGIPGPSGSHHGHRSARRAERRVDSGVRGCGLARLGETCSDSSSTSRRRASSSPKSGARWSVARSSPFGRPSGPAASSAPSTSSWSIPTTTRTASPTRCSRSPPFGAQQGLQRRRGGPARTTRRSGPAGSVRVSSKPVRALNARWPRSEPPRAAAGTDHRGRRAARARRRPTENDSRSQGGQERRRLRGRGEHLLCGQGGRRGHRLRHAAQVGHRRARFRPRVRLHGARPGQREPAQLPRLPARATATRSSARTSASTATARSRRTSTSSSSST